MMAESASNLKSMSIDSPGTQVMCSVSTVPHLSIDPAEAGEGDYREGEEAVSP